MPFSGNKLEGFDGRQFVQYDQRLDSAVLGPTWLSDQRIARLVSEEIRGVDLAELGKVFAYVVMPNHVHVLLQPSQELSRVTKRVKGRTARAANLILGRTGMDFWRDESFDHWIRNAAEFEKVRTYIERNPVKAGLVMRAENWKWSSAGDSPTLKDTD